MVNSRKQSKPLNVEHENITSPLLEKAEPGGHKYIEK